MKKAFIDFLNCVAAFSIAIMGSILLPIAIPFDFIHYILSPYYKLERRKYHLFAGSGIYFSIYNDIIRHGLPIQYIHNPADGALERGWFVCGDTLLIPADFPFEYDADSGSWNFCVDNDEDGETQRQVLLTIEEQLELGLQNVNTFSGTITCQRAVLLVDSDDIENAELAIKDPRFLLYDGNRVEVLKQFALENH